jgi:very-short-patch-repair endonuclease
MNPGQPDRDRLDAHAATQHGLFTRAQALSCGYSRARIRTKCSDDDWVVVVRDVYADRGLPITPYVRDTAAQLALPGSVLAGPSAARRHGIDVPNAGTFVALRRRIQVRHVQLLHEDLLPSDICQLDGAKATTPERTIYDCARLLPDATAEPLLTTALQEGWTTMPDLATRIRAATGRHGTPRLVRMVRGASTDNRAAAQHLATRLLQRAGIWGWHAQEPISDRWGLIGLGDLAFPTAKLVVELETNTLNPAPEETARLQERKSRLAAAGWTVTRFTWNDLNTRPTEVIDELRSTLDHLTPTRW